MVVSVRTCALALLATGCFVDEGFKPATSSATGGPATTANGSTDLPATTADATTDATAATTSAATTSTPSTTSTTAPATTSPATTDTPGCGFAGDPCDQDSCCGCLVCQNGACIPSADLCGTCQACSQTGTCDPVDPGTACTAVNDECSARVWGAGTKYCYAYDAASGTCDAGGNCIAGACEGMGAAIVSCINTQCTNPAACVTDAPADSVAGFCVETGQTDGCNSACSNTIDGGVLKIKQCASGGECAIVQEFPCGPYKCDGQTACKDVCDAEIDCAATASCVDGQCVYN